MAVRRTTDLSGLSGPDQLRVKNRADAYARQGQRSDLAVERAFKEIQHETALGASKHRSNARLA